jgi:hypothetical protein
VRLNSGVRRRRRVTVEAGLKQYLESGAVPPSLERSLADPAARRALYRVIVSQPIRPFRHLLLRLLDEEIRFREALWNGSVADPDDYFEGVYHCAFLLSRCGEPADTSALWKVQYLNQDIGEIDVGNFVGAGVTETLAFLDQRRDETSSEIASYIRESLSHPGTQEWMQNWESGCRTSIGGA